MSAALGGLGLMVCFTQSTFDDQRDARVIPAG
jgi:hypothetical protein